MTIIIIQLVAQQASLCPMCMVHGDGAQHSVPKSCSIRSAPRFSCFFSFFLSLANFTIVAVVAHWHRSCTHLCYLEVGQYGFPFARRRDCRVALVVDARFVLLVAEPARGQVWECFELSCSVAARSPPTYRYQSHSSTQLAQSRTRWSPSSWSSDAWVACSCGWVIAT